MAAERAATEEFVEMIKELVCILERPSLKLRERTRRDEWTDGMGVTEQSEHIL